MHTRESIQAACVFFGFPADGRPNIAEIDKQYKRLVRKMHPDQNPHRREEAGREFSKLAEYRTILVETFNVKTPQDNLKDKQHVKAQLDEQIINLQSEIKNASEEKTLATLAQEKKEISEAISLCEVKILAAQERFRAETNATKINIFREEYKRLCSEDKWAFMKRNNLLKRVPVLTIEIIEKEARSRPKDRVANAWQFTEALLDFDDEIKVSPAITPFLTQYNALTNRIENEVKTAEENIEHYKERKREIEEREDNWEARIRGREALRTALNAKLAQRSTLTTEIEKLQKEIEEREIKAPPPAAFNPPGGPDITDCESKRTTPKTEVDSFIYPTLTPEMMVSRFKAIYKALREGQTGLFKTNFLEGKENLAAKDYIALIQIHAETNPTSRTAKAWAITQEFYNRPLNGREIFCAVYQEAFAKSRVLSKSTLARNITLDDTTFYRSKSFNVFFNASPLTEEQFKTLDTNADNRTGKILRALSFR